MMGTHPHHPIEVSVARRELRQALITIITSKTTREGITTLDILMLISIIIMFLMMDINQDIEKHVPFVDYITIHFLNVGKDWHHTKG